MLRDYLVARRVMPIWVTSEERSDGQVAVHADELAVFEELLRVSPENIPMVGLSRPTRRWAYRSTAA